MTAKQRRALIDEIVIQALRDDVRKWQQRAEAAEAKAKNLNDGWLNAIAERDEARTEQGKLEAARSVRDNWKERAWAAEEKLAELEKQEPVAYLTWHQGFRSPDDCEDYLVVASNGDKSCDASEAFPVFTRPAPAADLADLVPDEMPRHAKGCEIDATAHWCDGWNSCRAAILAKLEIHK